MKRKQPDTNMSANILHSRIVHLLNGNPYFFSKTKQEFNKIVSKEDCIPVSKVVMATIITFANNKKEEKYTYNGMEVYRCFSNNCQKKYFYNEKNIYKPCKMEDIQKSLIVQDKDKLFLLYNNGNKQPKQIYTEEFVLQSMLTKQQNIETSLLNEEELENLTDCFLSENNKVPAENELPPKQINTEELILQSTSNEQDIETSLLNEEEIENLTHYFLAENNKVPTENELPPRQNVPKDNIQEFVVENEGDFVSKARNDFLKKGDKVYSFFFIDKIKFYNSKNEEVVKNKGQYVKESADSLDQQNLPALHPSTFSSNNNLTSTSTGNLFNNTLYGEKSKKKADSQERFRNVPAFLKKNTKNN